MAREIYFNDVQFSKYSYWHRSIKKKLAYIDIDKCGICHTCWQPLYLAELAFDVGQTYKTTSTTEALANMAGLPSFLVFYKVKNNEIVSFRVTQLTPEKGEEKLLTPDAWVQVMQLIQERHDIICEGKK